MNVFQLGAANGPSHVNLAKSIERPVSGDTFSTLSPTDMSMVEHELGPAPLYLWGSRNNRNRKAWLTMNPGDLVIFYTGDKIFRWCAEVTGISESVGLGKAVWGGEGEGIFSLLYSLKKPLEVNLELARVHKAADRHDHPRGLIRLNTQASEAIAQMIGISQPPDALSDLQEHKNEIDGADVPETEREALRKSRVGQGLFRDRLIKQWERCCAISGIDNLKLLRASHIKPWRDSDNRERLDRFNGLLLLPHFDHLFDAGYISFNDGGTIVISPELSETARDELSIHEDLGLTSIFIQHRPYLMHHRDHVFRE